MLTNDCRESAGRPLPRGLLVALGLLVVAGLWLLESCARNPEEPEAPIPIIILSDPDSVFRQIQVGLSQKFITSYMNAFSDSFHFVPDPDDLLFIQDFRPAEVYDGWDARVEEQVHQIILGSAGSIDVQFETEDTPTQNDTLVERWENYVLTIDSQDYIGQARLVMRRTEGQWRITFWQDIRLGLPADGDTTWGFERGFWRP
jgi:hypothetical protein